ncbi:hypothetical protein OIU34_08160 [Pararhizobium sp. BT-229]|nr:hypothetical protein [Pararhizobium sp. BT-229]MCV9961874.1 hypothetical protein [Pararhizobium sp. BT-229]
MTRLLGHLFRLLREGLLARTIAIGTQRRNSALIGRDTDLP